MNHNHCLTRLPRLQNRPASKTRRHGSPRPPPARPAGRLRGLCLRPALPPGRLPLRVLPGASLCFACALLPTSTSVASAKANANVVPGATPGASSLAPSPSHPSPPSPLQWSTDAQTSLQYTGSSVSHGALTSSPPVPIPASANALPGGYAESNGFMTGKAAGMSGLIYLHYLVSRAGARAVRRAGEGTRTTGVQARPPAQLLLLPGTGHTRKWHND